MAKYNYDKKALKGLGVGKFLGETKLRNKMIKNAPATMPKTWYNPNELAKRLHPEVQYCRIAKVVDHGGAKSFTLVPNEKKGTTEMAYFRASQYVSVSLNIDGAPVNKPYTIRSSTAIISQISPSIEEAAVSLGASELRSFTEVTLPMMMPGVISGAIMSWVTVISELSSSIMLYRGSTQTLTVSVYTEVIRDCFGNAAAYSIVLTVTSVLSLLLFFKLTGRRDISV